MDPNCYLGIHLVLRIISMSIVITNLGEYSWLIVLNFLKLNWRIFIHVNLKPNILIRFYGL